MACALGSEPFPLSHAHIQRQARGPPLLTCRPLHSVDPALPVLPSVAGLVPVGGPVAVVGLEFPHPPDLASLQPSESSGSPCCSWQEQPWAQTSCQSWTGHPGHPYLLSRWQRRRWWGWGRVLLSLGNCAVLSRALSPYSIAPHPPHVGLWGHQVESGPDLGKGEQCF